MFSFPSPHQPVVRVNHWFDPGLTPFLDISGLFEIVAQKRQLPLQSSIEDNFGSPAYQVTAPDYRRLNKLGMISSQMALPMLGEKGA